MKESALVGARKTGAEMRSRFSFSNAVWASGVHENGELGFASSRRGAATTEKFGTERSQNWAMPKNSFNDFALDGGGNSVIH